jgi:hypothetical protein
MHQHLHHIMELMCELYNEICVLKISTMKLWTQFSISNNCLVHPSNGKLWTQFSISNNRLVHPSISKLWIQFSISTNCPVHPSNTKFFPTVNEVDKLAMGQVFLRLP